MTVRQLSKFLKASLSPSDTQAILKTLLGCTHTQLVLRYGEELPEALSAKALSMKERREQGEPIQYITGTEYFFGREYEVGEGVLIPRDDTEVAVREALGLIPPDKPLDILDLCAGSGVIAVTLKKERPLCRVSAVEKSEEAFAYLQQNIRRNEADVRLILSDLSDCVECFPDGSLDLIISNPPYIKTSELVTLQKEVQREPRIALDGGKSGFDFYERIAALYSDKLRPGGYLVFEIGEEQSGYVSDLLRNAGFDVIRVSDDIRNIPRAITAKKSF